MITIEQIFISPGHNFFGRHQQPPGNHAMIEQEKAECVAGHGLRGDRFFGYKPDYKGQITLFSVEVFAQLARDLGLLGIKPQALRRNLLVRGADLGTLIGRTFALQGVQFEGVEECRPCYWMDSAITRGAEAWLRARGGLRCRVLTSGWLKRETATSLPTVPPRRVSVDNAGEPRESSRAAGC